MLWVQGVEGQGDVSVGNMLAMITLKTRHNSVSQDGSGVGRNWCIPRTFWPGKLSQTWSSRFSWRLTQIWKKKEEGRREKDKKAESDRGRTHSQLHIFMYTSLIHIYAYIYPLTHTNTCAHPHRHTYNPPHPI